MILTIILIIVVMLEIILSISLAYQNFDEYIKNKNCPAHWMIGLFFGSTGIFSATLIIINLLYHMGI